jgi:hypothetical protein
MTQKALAHLARLLWPYLKPYVLEAIEHGKMDDIASRATAAADSYIKASERLKRKYVKP